jgi:hypothetical protein
MVREVRCGEGRLRNVPHADLYSVGTKCGHGINRKEMVRGVRCGEGGLRNVPHADL